MIVETQSNYISLSEIIYSLIPFIVIVFKYWGRAKIFDKSNLPVWKGATPLISEYTITKQVFGDSWRFWVLLFSNIVKYICGTISLAIMVVLFFAALFDGGDISSIYSRVFIFTTVLCLIFFIISAILTIQINIRYYGKLGIDKVAAVLSAFIPMIDIIISIVYGFNGTNYYPLGEETIEYKENLYGDNII